MAGKKFFEYEDVKVVTLCPNSNCDVIRAEFVSSSGKRFVVEALKMLSVSNHKKADFLPAKIFIKKDGEEENGEPVWLFNRLRELGFSGYAKLFRLEAKAERPQTDLIGLFNKCWELLAVIPLSLLGHGVTDFQDGEFPAFISREIGFDELFRLKQELIDQENLYCTYSPSEREILNAEIEAQLAESRKRQEEARQQYQARMEEKRMVEAARLKKFEDERARKLAEGAAKEKVKSERKKALQERPKIAVRIIATGEKILAVPTVGVECQAFNAVRVVTVESYDERTGKASGPLEVFLARKTKGGRPYREEVMTGLSLEAPRHDFEETEQPVVNKTVAVVEPLKKLPFKIGGQTRIVDIYGQGMLGQLAKRINYGTVVGMAEGEGTYKLYSLKEGQVLPQPGLHVPA